MDNIRKLLEGMYESVDEETKEAIDVILNESIVERCKCPMCGEKFDPRENLKYAKTILPPK